MRPPPRSARVELGEPFDKLRPNGHGAANAHLTLNDLREVKIQPQEVVAAFRAMLAAPQYRSRRLAFVARPTLARNQLLRAIANRDARCFEDPVTAEAWLLRGETAQVGGLTPPRSSAARS